MKICRDLGKKGAVSVSGLLIIGLSALLVAGAFLLTLLLTGGFDAPAQGINGVDVGTGSGAADDRGTDVAVKSNINYEISEELPAEIDRLILSYYEQRYKALGKLEYSSTDRFFDKTRAQGNMYSCFSNTTLQLLIFIRAGRPVDLSYESCSFTVNISSAVKSKDTYDISFTVSDATDFAFSDVTSYSCGMAADARIIKNDKGEYKFEVLAEDTDINLLVEEQVLKELGYDIDSVYLKDIVLPDGFKSAEVFSSILKRLKKNAEADILAQREMLERFNASPSDFSFSVTADIPYDRTAAADYSYKWAGKDKPLRNPEYSDYSMYGGNCQNYASQCLHAGGIPMDLQGENQWKWFDDRPDISNNAAGRSMSWSVVEKFCEYCVKNSGYGISAEVCDNIYLAQPGDVMQYIAEGAARHSVVVSRIVYDKNGNIADILINSNTTDRVDFPLSAYGYTGVRLIHIAGYNEE